MNSQIVNKVISVTNQKGGVGKTATTRFLADILVDRGYSVLVIDLDPQASLTKGYGLEPDTFIGTNASNITRIFGKEDEIALIDISPEINTENSAEYKHTETGLLHILPSNKELGTVGQSGTIGKETALKRYIKKAGFKDAYDVIIIDNNPKFDAMTINSILACDTMVIPVIASRDEIDGIKGFVDSTDDTLLAYEHVIKEIVIVPTMYEPNTRVFQEYLSIMQENIPSYINALGELGHANNTITEPIPKNIAFREGSSLGLSAYAFLNTPRGKTTIKKERREKIKTTLNDITDIVIGKRSI